MGVFPLCSRRDLYRVRRPSQVGALMKSMAHDFARWLASDSPGAPQARALTDLMGDKSQCVLAIRGAYIAGYTQAVDDAAPYLDQIASLANPRQ